MEDERFSLSALVIAVILAIVCYRGIVAFVAPAPQVVVNAGESAPAEQIHEASDQGAFHVIQGVWLGGGISMGSALLGVGVVLGCLVLVLVIVNSIARANQK